MRNAPSRLVRAAATADPAGLIATLKTPVAIDEIQRVPELMTEIKLRVDRDKTPGQFAITGSANLLEMKQVKDSLAGRAEYLRLHPFSQGELRGHRESFIPGLANGSFPNVTNAPVGRQAYADILAKGGYPEVQGRASHRRPRFFESLDLGGMFYETFVAMELHRQMSWLDDRPQLFHFRDRDQREVDIVIEHRDGSISAVEVKSTATVHKRDFRGLNHLKDKLGNKFKAGALLYTGPNTVSFGDRLAAVPLSGLWTP